MEMSYLLKLHKEFILETNIYQEFSLSLEFKNWIEKRGNVLKNYATLLKMGGLDKKEIIVELGTGAYDSLIPYLADEYYMMSVSKYASTFEKIGFKNLSGELVDNKIVCQGKKLNTDCISTFILSKYSTSEEKEFALMQYLNGKTIIMGSYAFNADNNKGINFKNLELLKLNLSEIIDNIEFFKKNFYDKNIHLRAYKLKRK